MANFDSMDSKITGGVRASIDEAQEADLRKEAAERFKMLLSCILTLHDMLDKEVKYLEKAKG